jgi:hypothetical protein
MADASITSPTGPGPEHIETFVGGPGPSSLSSASPKRLPAPSLRLVTPAGA